MPNSPDVVYEERGWAGWDDFLNGPIEDLTDILDPAYKRGKLFIHTKTYSRTCSNTSTHT